MQLQIVELAFRHASNALAKLGTTSAKERLRRYLYHEEPWIRVDAASALARCSDEEMVLPLMRAMLAQHILSDYMAVVVARRHLPKHLLLDERLDVQEGACELIIGVIEAAQQTFRWK